MSMDNIDDVNAIDIQYIKRVEGDRCGISSRFAYLRNIHPSITIIATLEERTNLDTGPSSRTFDVELPPNRDLDFNTPNERDVYLGCPIPGPTPQLFEWVVVSARVKQ